LPSKRVCAPMEFHLSSLRDAIITLA
jgi:hypothetical protein